MTPQLRHELGYIWQHADKVTTMLDILVNGYRGRASAKAVTNHHLLTRRKMVMLGATCLEYALVPMVAIPDFLKDAALMAREFVDGISDRIAPICSVARDILERNSRSWPTPSAPIPVSELACQYTKQLAAMAVHICSRNTSAKVLFGTFYGVTPVLLRCCDAITSHAANLMRCICGPTPHKDETYSLEYVSDLAVTQIAQAIYNDNLWHDTYALADALLDAGYTNPEVINHLRLPPVILKQRCHCGGAYQPAKKDMLPMLTRCAACGGDGPFMADLKQVSVPVHSRGCFVFDRLLGKS